MRFMDVNSHDALMNPVDDVPSTGWVAVSPKTIGNFSAVGYFFGRKLHQELKIPIGLIGSNWGGTRSEPWTPPEGFARVPELKEISDRLTKEAGELKQRRYAAIPQLENWLAAARAAKAADRVPPAVPGSLIPARPNHQDPTRIYNGMLHGLVPFGIKGAIWYQGESNAGDGQGYFHKKKALIEGWREIWGQGDFPFYFVQLAPFRSYSNWARVWGGQIATLQLPNTGMAVTTDIGNLRDIHPKNKQDVGLRLALQALHRDYGQKGLVFRGPLFKSAEFATGKAVCQFDGVGSGLIASDGKPLRTFEMAGADKRFMPATAEVVGNTIIVTCEAVQSPASVRMCWSGNEAPNLANREGLPASPFRSDDW
jgi:sialate O-acetylesterase